MLDEQTIVRDLGGGLILRKSTPADADRLAAFNGYIFRDLETNTPQRGIAAWTHDLLSKPHPTFDPSLFTVVEDTTRDPHEAYGQVISSLCLIPQTWQYRHVTRGGNRVEVSFGAGRPEIVGTLEGYRRRGLIREQFNIVHRWSEERGDLIQFITGIPFYYRQYGYEMALDLGGGRMGYANIHVPKLKAGDPEPYTLRAATEADIPFIASVYEYSVQRYEISAARDEAIWRYDLSGRSKLNETRLLWFIIESAEGDAVGILAHQGRLNNGDVLDVYVYELAAGVSWLAVTPSVVRHLQRMGEQFEVEYNEPLAPEARKRFVAYHFGFSETHPVYEAFGDSLPRTHAPYAFYMRVPDMVAFLDRIRPVLEARIAESIAVGHTGEFKLSFYRDGVRFVFERGKIAAVERWQPVEGDWAGAAVPPMQFLNLLFGRRSWEEIRHLYPDAWTGGDGNRVLMKTMFPKHPSTVFSVT
jgi:hypothetical protein